MRKKHHFLDICGIINNKYPFVEFIIYDIFLSGTQGEMNTNTQMINQHCLKTKRF